MAPRTYSSATKTNGTATAAATKRSRTLQAKCQENQSFVDQLAEKREQIAPGNNFTFTLKKAMDSIIAFKEPITSYEEAVALKGIGPSIGKMLFPLPKSCKQPKAAAATKGRKKKALEDSSNAASSSSSSQEEESVSGSSPIASSESVPSAAAANLKRRPNKQEIASMALKSQQVKQPVTKKEKVYLHAVQEAENYKGRNLLWQLVLLIDKREKQCEHYSSKVAQCGVPTEIRTLPIGDMAWIAQGRTRRSNNNGNNNHGGGEIVAELMLGTIVERKEVADLVSSLFGTRYNEQQLRLKASGLPQVIFLIEGDTKSDQRRFTADALNSVLWAIRIEKQNQVVQTEHMEETVNTLRLMHRRILKRTFPTAFYAEALPAFSEPGVGAGAATTAAAVGRARQRDSFGEQRRRRRRRLESLHGLTFDQEPVPMAGMPRFITYQELCAKVERDREMGTRTIGNIHQAMLKQVQTIGDKKIIAINREYPTPHSLLQAYDQMPNGSSIAARKALLVNLRLDEDEADNPDVVAAGTIAKVLGEKSAGELAIAYSVDESVERRNSVDGINNNIVGDVQQANGVGNHAPAATKSAVAAAATTKAKTNVNPIATAATKRSILAAAAASRAGSAAPTISSVAAVAAVERPEISVTEQEAADLERAIAASLLETTTTAAARKQAHAPSRSTVTSGASKTNQKKSKSSQQEKEDWKSMSREELFELLSSSSSSSDDEAVDTKMPAKNEPVAATKKRPMSCDLSDDSLSLSPSPPPSKKRPSTGSTSSSNNDEGNLGPGLDWSSSIDGTKTSSARNNNNNNQSQKQQQKQQQGRPMLLESSSSDDDDDDDDADFAATQHRTGSGQSTTTPIIRNPVGAPRQR